jgi:hypothetical protein
MQTVAHEHPRNRTEWVFSVEKTQVSYTANHQYTDKGMVDELEDAAVIVLGLQVRCKW